MTKLICGAGCRELEFGKGIMPTVRGRLQINRETA